MGSAYLCTFAAFLPTFSFLGRAVSSLAYVQIAVFSPALSLPSFFHTPDAFFCYILQSLTSSQALLSAPLALSSFFLVPSSAVLPLTSLLPHVASPPLLAVSPAAALSSRLLNGMRDQAQSGSLASQQPFQSFQPFPRRNLGTSASFRVLLETFL